MLVRIPLLLAHFALLGCGINNNCGKYNPFGCAKGDESGDVEVTSLASETTSTTPASTSIGPTTTVGESSTGTTTPVEPTTTTSTTTIETATLDTTTTESSMTSDTASSTAETTSTTGDPCGNGLIEDLEECDDGNDVANDSCDLQCMLVHRKVFVSSLPYQGDLGGLDGADAKCQGLANAALPKPVGTFRAWLSTDKESAAEHIGPEFTGIYELTNGTAVAVGLKGLTNPPLINAIDRNEKGTPFVVVGVWTGTGANGMAFGSHCNSWQSPGIQPTATTGVSSSKDGTWTNMLEQTCSGSNHLYCFEVQ